MNKDLKSNGIRPILEVSASHITAVTDALVEKEWITRIRSKEDRRIIRIHITEAGEKIVDHFNQKKQNTFLNGLTATLMKSSQR